MARNSVRHKGKLATWRLHDILRQLRLDNEVAVTVDEITSEEFEHE